MRPNLVSIVVPVFNRVGLVSETLDSILSQTYINWECILVDDGSTDGTIQLLKEYALKDPRFIVLSRDDDRKKGANACRNIGLENAKGDYIIFFDSDDLMTPHHIEFKQKKMIESGADFVITKTSFFNGDNTQIEKYYSFGNEDISALNFVLKRIKWLTYDTCIKSALAKKIRYNENLKSGQEFNYNVKLLLLTTNAYLYHEVVTLRRKHGSSIRSKIDHDKNLINEGTLNSHLNTYHDVRNTASSPLRKALVVSCVDIIYSSSAKMIYDGLLMNKAILYEYHLRGLFWYFMAMRLKQSKIGRFKNWSYYFKCKLTNRASYTLLQNANK